MLINFVEGIKQQRNNNKNKSNPQFFQAEDGIRDVERSRGLGDVYKRQKLHN